MPRINIEDSVWSDARFAVLQVHLASEIPGLDPIQIRPLAIGWLVSAWKTAQRYWLDERSPIPAAIWTKGKFPQSIIDSDLARVDEHGNVCIAGISDAFDWIVKSIENGKKGGRPKKSNDLINPMKPNETQRNLLKPSSSSSSSSSSSTQNTNTNTNTNTFNAGVGSLPVADAPASRKPKSSKPPTEGTEVWNAYRDSMLKTWSMDPPRSAKTASQATQLVGLVGLEKAKELAAYYPTRRSQWYVTKGHPFGLLLTDHMALLRELSAGMKMTKEVVDEIVGQENLQTHEQLREMKPSIYSDEWDDWYEKQQQLNGEKRNELLPEAN